MSVSDLATYVAALPECAEKATLRGLVVAAHVVEGDTVDERLIARMRGVVTAYFKRDPMRTLEHALSRCQGAEGPSSESS